jgi:hypothetical protein
VNESVTKEAALEWLLDLGYTVMHGPDLSPGEPDTIYVASL